MINIESKIVLEHAEADALKIKAMGSALSGRRIPLRYIYELVSCSIHTTFTKYSFFFLSLPHFLFYLLFFLINNVLEWKENNF